MAAVPVLLCEAGRLLGPPWLQQLDATQGAPCNPLVPPPLYSGEQHGLNNYARYQSITIHSGPG